MGRKIRNLRETMIDRLQSVKAWLMLRLRSEMEIKVVWHRFFFIAVNLLLTADIGLKTNSYRHEPVLTANHKD